MQSLLRKTRAAFAEGGEPLQTWLEIGFIFLLFYLFAGCPPPDVNEAHYLTKAKHYWNPDWCSSDLFLQSADAHVAFFWTFGWLTRWFSLATVAWLGRLITWGLLAWAWQRLTATMVQIRFASVLAAAWFVLLLDRFHVAGEWIIGGVEAKGFAYVLLLWGLRAMILGHWRAIWLWLGAASAFHVLVGGWSVVIAGLVWLSLGRTRPPLRSMLPALLLGFLFSLPGLLPALWLTAGVDATITRLANQIYVFGRLGHHLVFHQFPVDRIVAFQWLIAVWLAITWFLAISVGRAMGAITAPHAGREAWYSGCHPSDVPDRIQIAGYRRWLLLGRFTLGALLLAAIGTGLDFALRGQPILAAKLLRLYWFRAGDVAVPMSVALSIPLLAARLDRAMPRLRHGLIVLSILIPSAFLFGVFVDHQQDFRPRARLPANPVDRIGNRQAAADFYAWKEVCAWINQRTAPEARFLTPRGQQTFKWYAGRSEVAAWKDIPQDAEGIVQWFQLIQEVYPRAVQQGGLGAWSDQELWEICRCYEVDYILVDRSQTTRRLGFPRVYPDASLSNASYEVYDVRF